MAVTSPGAGDAVAFTQGATTALPGGNRTVGAMVRSASGLIVTVMAHLPENTNAVVAGVNHASVAAAGAPSWSWSTASGHSNS